MKLSFYLILAVLPMQMISTMHQECGIPKMHIINILRSKTANNDGNSYSAQLLDSSWIIAHHYTSGPCVGQYSVHKSNDSGVVPLPQAKAYFNFLESSWENFFQNNQEQNNELAHQ